MDKQNRLKFLMSTDLKNLRIERLARASCLLPLSLFLFAAAQVPRTAAGETFRWVLEWIPALNIHLSFLFDGLSLLFVLIITGVGFFVTLYGVDYLRGQARTGRFFIFLHAFMLSMAGLVCADNAIALFVFWELTTLFSYLLIGFDHENAASRTSARQALLVTGAGGLALLVGFLLLEMACGTYEISQMAALSEAIKIHPFYGAILFLVFIGAFTKSAQFPFHFWLPNAMAAPAPVSAFLHSATMVKGGIYLLARLHPVLGGTIPWEGTLVVVGGGTALLGAFTALNQTDLKKILAFTTITALGIMTLLLGGETLSSITAVMTFLLVHALYKSALFLSAGIVDHQCGTREIGNLGGLARFLPFTAAATGAACLSMAGFPLFFGFIGKEIMYKGILAEALMPEIAISAAVLANSLMTAVAGMLVIRPFFLGRGAFPGPVAEASPLMWIGPVVLGGLGIFFGIIPDWVGTWLVGPAVVAVHAGSGDVHLALFHGINEPLLLSVATLTLGTGLYLGRGQVNQWMRALFGRMPFKSGKAWDGVLNGVAAISSLQTRILQSGSLHRYFFVVAAAFVIIAGAGYVRGGMNFPEVGPAAADLSQWLLVLLMLSAVGAVLVTRSALLAICALGVVGAGIALIFMSFGAPDLALTQLLVETLTVIIVSIVLLHLPDLAPRRRKYLGRRIRDGILAVAMGTLVTLLLLSVLAHPLDRSMTAFFEAHSYVSAHGRNVVNVILVDFRSLDTLGEIIVVATAGLAGFALIQKRRRKP